MAIDSAFKRFSMASVGDLEYANRVPDATDMDEAGDRQNEMFLYAFDASSVGSGVFGDRRRRSAVAILAMRGRGS